MNSTLVDFNSLPDYKKKQFRDKKKVHLKGHIKTQNYDNEDDESADYDSESDQKDAEYDSEEMDEGDESDLSENFERKRPAKSEVNQETKDRL